MGERPDTLFFSPGGMYDREVLIAGRIGTASSSPISKQLMKLCRAEISRRFTRVKGYRLGPGALALLHRGTRLIQDI